MFKRKVLLLCVSAICVLGLLASSATVLADDGDTPVNDNEDGNVVGYVIHGDEVQPLVIGEGIEWITPGETWAEFIDSRQMSPEEKAAIVHDVPPCPVVIDGTLYKPEQIHLFDGQPLGFTTCNHSTLSQLQKQWKDS